ncbi:hypothetical protein FHG87_002795 [Trinorchestia longiramus]|nr:hypothetical protein FHG87_002795 [Trinorchestia longiramus]
MLASYRASASLLHELSVGIPCSLDILKQNDFILKGSLGIADRQKRELMFAPTRSVILCLLFFPPVHRSPVKVMALFGSSCQKSQVSSRLKTSSAENCPSKGRRTCYCHSRKDRKSTDPASPCTVLNVMPWRFLKLSSQPSLAMNSGMCISSGSFIGFSLIRSPPTGRFCPLACFSQMSTPSSIFGS